MNLLIICEGVWLGTAAAATQRLQAAGHVAYVERRCSGGEYLLRAILALEGLLLGAGANAKAAPIPNGFVPDLIIDLTGEENLSGVPLMTVEINGWTNLEKGVASLKNDARRAHLVVLYEGREIDAGVPMISEQTLFSHNRDELLTALVSLIVHNVSRISAGRTKNIARSSESRTKGTFLHAYLTGLSRSIAGRMTRRRSAKRPFYWQTAWRLLDGPGIAETRQLQGQPFNVIGDDGDRFYADPFPFEHEGHPYIFVEEYPYATGKGKISVTKMGGDGGFQKPYGVLEEPHHLSYPNVFRHGGEIYMLPESGGAAELVLYRAERFPDRWVRHSVLMSGRSINDATIFQYGERLWMFATERYGAGSASDTMVVFSANKLSGPWSPHRFNPILVDRAGARPGGHVVEKEGRHFLPVQDGSRQYGGGLGLREIVQLNDDDVVLGPVQPIFAGPAWMGKSIHTLNRAGRLEVVDSTC
jgi:hypothetical protein